MAAGKQHRDESSRGATPATFGRYLVYATKREFTAFKVKRDMGWGAVVGVGTMLLQIGWHLSPRLDWRDHPIELTLSIVIPFLLVVVLDILWKFLKALWKTCNATARIREDSLIVSAICGGAMIYTGLVLYSIYISSPHLRLLVYEYCMVNSKSFPQPTSEMLLQMEVRNSGTPTTASDWSVEVELPSGEIIRGRPTWHPTMFRRPTDNTVFKIVTPDQLIFARTVTTQIKKDEPIQGYALFYFEGVREEILLTPSNVITISCRDIKGGMASRSFPVAAHVETWVAD